ncbi:MAG: class II aldolase [Deltaproteobacteria bacterium]|nr:class II aldolase [Deltaproteobacteria bacterium]
MSVNREQTQLEEMCRSHGADPDMVQGGGGNASFKPGNGGMWVTLSGVRLKSARFPEGFVQVDLDAIRSIVSDRSLSGLPQARLDQAVLRRVLESRTSPTSGRPSIETMIHAMLPGRLAIHTHPVHALALVCLRDGPEVAARLFDDRRFLWIPYAKPGLFLTIEFVRGIEEHARRTGTKPQWFFMQNHGLILTGDSPENIEKLRREVFSVLRDHFGDAGVRAKQPTASPGPHAPCPVAAECACCRVRHLLRR